MKAAALAALLTLVPAAARADMAQDVLGARSSVRALVSQIAHEQGVTDAAAHQMVARESRYNARAVGRVGEIGLVQIKLSTARALGFRGTRAQLFEPRTNLTFGLKYLRMAIARGCACYYQRGIPR